MSISKVKTGSETKPRKRKITEGVLPKVYCPVQQPVPSSTFSSSLIDQLTAINSDAQILKVLKSGSTQSEVESKFGTVPKGSVLSYQQKPSSSPHSDKIHPQHPETFPAFLMPALDMNYSSAFNHRELSLFMGLHVNVSISMQIEEETREQSSNKTWHSVREHRLTSSIFKDVCSRKGDFDTLCSRLLKKKIQTAAMKRGIDSEPLAAQAYAEITGNSVYMCGFVINPSCRHLGTSPDRKVFDPTGAFHYGLLEIKCPMNQNFSSCAR
jgi:hypothetical protein